MTAQLSELGEHALFYAEAGALTVFPLWGVQDGRCLCPRAALPEDHENFCGVTRTGEVKGSPGKHPMTRNGLKDASRDPEKIRYWWGRAPLANIGLPAGDNGFAILDEDPRHGGNESFARLHEYVLEAAGFDLTATQVARTGSGGGHYLYAAPEGGITNKANAFGSDMPGIDTRGRGGYIVAWPSWHISGGQYEWITEIADPAPWPEILTKLMDPPKLATPVTRIRDRGDRTRYAESALDKELDRLREAGAAGEGARNNTLNVSAFNLGQLVGEGAISESVVRGELVSVGVSIGLGMSEVLRTVNSGITAGMSTPRTGGRAA